EAFLKLMREVTGFDRLCRVATQATRFRPGHFISFHSGTCASDRTLKRRVSFSLNLTPEWRPDRGGLLEFRRKEGDVIEAYMSVFNSLDVIVFPLGWWISTVARFSQDPIYAVAGRIYV